MKKTTRRYLAYTSLVTVSIFLSACASGQLKTAQSAYRQGNINEAAATISGLAAKEKIGARDSELVFLEQGSILSTAGRSAEANTAFKNADQSITTHLQAAKIQLGNEAGAMLSNLNALPYRSSPSERLMGAALLASSFAEKGEFTPARSAVANLRNRQNEIINEFQKQIDREQATLQEAINQDPKMKIQLDLGQVEQAQQRLQANASKYTPYKEYMVPYAEALAGVILGAGPNAEPGRASEYFTRALACHPNAKSLQRARSGLSGTTNIFIEDGVGPSLGSFRFDIPIVINGSFTTLSAAFPTFEPTPLVGTPASLEVGGSNVTPDVICEFDRIAAKEFERKLPGTIAKTMASSTLKAVASIAAQMAAEQIGGDYGGIAKLGVGLVSTGYNIGSAQADQRIWATLPKQVRFACVGTPSNGEIEVGGIKVKLPGKTNLVIARVINGQVHIRTSAL
jgi:hypothetical protein